MKAKGFWISQAPSGAIKSMKMHDFGGPRCPEQPEKTYENIRFWSSRRHLRSPNTCETQDLGAPRAPEEPEHLGHRVLEPKAPEEPRYL